ncbi:hypothetical protein [Actinomyces gerencseriae]|uniref:hypothetical protein n=1 Tax=Actinomyces gerencseriae TaxID=52769 RepID=UPI0012EC1C76|nr:hypothetical protein [Actinomyces gerencseriae]
MDLGALRDVVVRQTYRLVGCACNPRMTDQVEEARIRSNRRPVPELMFPAGFDAMGSPERAGGLPLEVWDSPWAAPVPCTSQWYIVLDGRLYPRGSAGMHYMATGKSAYDVVLHGWWSPRPVGLPMRPYGGGLVSEPLAAGRSEGEINVGTVRARWRGQDVEVTRVVYSRAYLKTVVVRGRGRLTSWVGPVRLDELEDVRFEAEVRRRPGAGAWSFLRVWGLAEDAEGEVEGRLERGVWQSWPRAGGVAPLSWCGPVMPLYPLRRGSLSGWEERFGGLAPSLTGPVWAGTYATRVRRHDWVDLLPAGVVARWDVEGDPEHVSVPGSVPCPEGFVADPDRGVWVMEVPADAGVSGFEAVSWAVLEESPVEVVEVWGERARVRGCGDAGEGRWVGLGALRQVVVERTAVLCKERDSLEVRRDPVSSGYPSRLVFPVGFDAWACPQRSGGVDARRWPSPLCGPVPASGQYLVYAGVPYPLVDSPGTRYDWGEPGFHIEVDSWCRAPAELGLRQLHGDLVSRDLFVDECEGLLWVGRVRAWWRGREVEVVRVAYAYAYVAPWVDEVDGEESVRGGSGDSDGGSVGFDELIGPVRLDELDDVRFPVSISRHSEAGLWHFLEMWGLPADECRYRVEAHMDHGAWPAWPRVVDAEQA